MLRKCRKYRVFLEDSYGTIPITSIKRMERLEKRIRETGKKMEEEGLKEVKRSFKDRTLRNLDED